jgi:hypothetical protein
MAGYRAKFNFTLPISVTASENPLKCPQKQANGPDPDLKELIPNSPTLFLYYSFYYNPPIHAKFQE